MLELRLGFVVIRYGLRSRFPVSGVTHEPPMSAASTCDAKKTQETEMIKKSATPKSCGAIIKLNTLICNTLI